jgi:hypothetical protein
MRVVGLGSFSSSLLPGPVILRSIRLSFPLPPSGWKNGPFSASICSFYCLDLWVSALVSGFLDFVFIISSLRICSSVWPVETRREITAPSSPSSPPRSFWSEVGPIHQYIKFLHEMNQFGGQRARGICSFTSLIRVEHITKSVSVVERPQCPQL